MRALSWRWIRPLIGHVKSKGSAHRPDFDSARLDAQLSEHSPAYAAFGSKYRRQAEAAESVDWALTTIAAYYRSRRRPRFFIDAEQIRSATRYISMEHPDWRSATLRRVRQQSTKSLSIYTSHGPALNIDFPWGDLEPGPGNDKLYRKRPHRFAFAPSIGLATLYDEPCASSYLQVLERWSAFASEPRNRIAYDSNLGVLQRVLALTWAWAFLSARPLDAQRGVLELEGAVLKVIAADIRFLSRRLGNSFANNHLLADGFIGWFISLIWPEMIDFTDRIDTCEQVFLHELERQILRDGTSFEHSMHYHEFACEMTASYVILNRRNGHCVPNWVVERLERMLRFQVDMCGPDAVPVRIGDATEDTLFPLDSDDEWGTAAWVVLLGALFESQPPGRALSSERAFWLLGGDVPKQPVRNAGKAGIARLSSYPVGGYHSFAEPGGRRRLIFRSAPEMDAPISAGHAHADLMSVYLTLDGTPCIVDSGTYTYRADMKSWPAGTPAWRRYFTGPGSHNTLSIHGNDPLGNCSGDFRPANIDVRAITRKCCGGAPAAWVEAKMDSGGVYDGYRRGVVHIPGEQWLIYDVLPISGIDDDATITFQLAPMATITSVSESTVCATVDNVNFSITAVDGLARPEILNGSRSPPAGWVSVRYGELLEAPQVRFALGQGKGGSPVAFVINSSGNDPSNISVIASEDDRCGLCIRIQQGRTEDRVVLNTHLDGRPLGDDEFRFTGELLWLRRVSAQPTALRWLAGRSFTSADGIHINADRLEKELQICLEGGKLLSAHASNEPPAVRWPGSTEL